MSSGNAIAVQEKLMGLDLGMARIGVSVCDPLWLAARPLTVIARRSRNEDFALLANLVSEEQVEALICGLPLTMDGSEGDQAKTTRKWAQRLAYALRSILGRPYTVTFWDERLSTFGANEILDRLDAHDIPEDAAAAAVILQSYLDARRQGDVADYGRIVLPAKSQP